MGPVSIEMYDKFGLLLRVETIGAIREQVVRDELVVALLVVAPQVEENHAVVLGGAPADHAHRIQVPLIQKLRFFCPLPSPCFLW